MKTFKQHVNEHSYNGGQVGAATSNSVEDGAAGAHNIQDAAVLQKVTHLLVLLPKGNTYNHNLRLTN